MKTQSNHGAERRTSKRHICDGFAEVLVPSSGFLFRGEIVDLSETGCNISTRARLKLTAFTEAELRFSVNGNRFSVPACVASVRIGIGAGFQFLPVDSSVLENLLQIIEELTAQEADTLER